MSAPKTPAGTIGWIDLTADNATELRSFYHDVIGWHSEAVTVEDHEDFVVGPHGGQPMAGLCHALPPNTGIPPQWLVYFHVDDLDASLAACTAAGGSVVRAPVGMGGSRMAIIQDPAGAVCALYQEGTPE